MSRNPTLRDLLSGDWILLPPDGDNPDPSVVQCPVEFGDFDINNKEICFCKKWPINEDGQVEIQICICVTL